MKVSVIIPFYKQEKFIKQTIDSLKKQSFKNFECILVDNASVDNSIKIAEKEIAGDSRFKIVFEPERGIDKALNRGIVKAKGGYIVFLDADDWLDDKYLEFVLKEIEGKKVDVLFSSSIIHDERKGEIREFSPYWFSKENFPYLLFEENRIRSMSYITIKKEALLEMLPFPEKFNLALDYYIAILSVLNKLNIIFSNKRLVHKRYHSDNMAYDRFLSDMQDIKLKDFFLRRYPLKSFFTKKELEIIFTKHYIKGANYGRRKGLFKELQTYMKEFVKDGYIREEFFVYFSSLYLILNNDVRTFEEKLRRIKKEHPIIDFLLGIFYKNKNMNKKALLYFEKAYVRSYENFPESLNSYAVLISKDDIDKGKDVLRQIISRFPDYKDAYYNYNKLNKGELNKLRHTIHFMPQTLNFFLYYHNR